uniref:Malate dehydrogenase 1B, NAD (soluble) n=1 Tax=Sinocyclocheilus rhinocerous TaxID=307959 RepID=A0A673KQD2_9TELE
MAKLVLAGKADCPYYAKAELLADVLQRNLPDFHIHEICVHPNDWEVKNGWEELIDRGAKGLLLGGFSDFLEHAQGYYGITSDMNSDVMLKMSAENRQTKELCIEEEIHRHVSLRPLHIWISSALIPICYSLIPQLFSTGLFPSLATFSLHLMDADGSEEMLQGLKMETEDLAHFIIFLDDLQPVCESNDVQDDKDHMVIWGNISGSFHIDLQRAKVFRCDGTIWGPDGFSQQVMEMIYYWKWLQTDFMSLVHKHRTTISSKTNKATAISTTNGIMTILKAWNNDASPEDVFSLGVISTGQFGIPAGLVFSVSFRDGCWSACSDVTVTDELRQNLTLERDIAARILKMHDSLLQ